MRKTFCDRCGAECDGVAIQRFTIFDVNKSIDVCDSCYREFFRWLKNKDAENFEYPCTDDLNEFVKESLENPKPMDQDKMINLAVNTIKKYNEDGKWQDNCKDDGDKCAFYSNSWHQEPCESCTRKRIIFAEKIQENYEDHYVRKEKIDEN